MYTHNYVEIQMLVFSLVKMFWGLQSQFPLDYENINMMYKIEVLYLVFLISVFRKKPPVHLKDLQIT